MSAGRIDDLVERFAREWRDAEPTSAELALAELSVSGVGIMTLLGEIAKAIASRPGDGLSRAELSQLYSAALDRANRLERDVVEYQKGAVALRHERDALQTHADELQRALSDARASEKDLHARVSYLESLLALAATNDAANKQRIAAQEKVIETFMRHVNTTGALRGAWTQIVGGKPK